MISSVLITDDLVPFARDFAAVCAERSMNPCLLSSRSSIEDRPVWNRSSRLSAHSLCLDVKNRYGTIDSAVLCFDATAFSVSVAELADIVDSLVKAYIILCERLEDVLSKQGAGHLCFVLCEQQQSKGSEVQLPVQREVRMAEAAFRILAEDCAVRLNASLIRVDNAERMNCAQWLADRIAAPHRSKSSASWVKAASRGILGFM